MSGGYFDYKQYEIYDIRKKLEETISNNGDDLEYIRECPEDIIEEFKDALIYLQISEIYVQRIDWLLSGDDGEDCFRKRLKEDFQENGFEKIDGNWRKKCVL